jgi:hypothetical protein
MEYDVTSDVLFCQDFEFFKFSRISQLMSVLFPCSSGPPVPVGYVSVRKSSVTNDFDVLRTV